MEKKYIIKGVLNSSVLSINSYGTYSLINIYHDAKKIKFFDSKEDAESYIQQNNLSPVTIMEIFI